MPTQKSAGIITYTIIKMKSLQTFLSEHQNHLLQQNLNSNKIFIQLIQSHQVEFKVSFLRHTVILNFNNSVWFKLFTRHQLLMFTQPGVVIHILYSTEKPSKQENKHLNMNTQTEMQNLLLKGILLTTCIKNIAKTDDLAKLMAR